MSSFYGLSPAIFGYTPLLEAGESVPKHCRALIRKKIGIP
jgi:hypothetical protein